MQETGFVCLLRIFKPLNWTASEQAGRKPESQTFGVASEHVEGCLPLLLAGRHYNLPDRAGLPELPLGDGLIHLIASLQAPDLPQADELILVCLDNIL